MNIKRGLFRFWLIVTLLWIAAAGGYSLNKLAPQYPRQVAAIDATRMVESIAQARLFESGKMSAVACTAYSAAVTTEKLYSLIPIDCAMYSLMYGNPLATTIKHYPLTFRVPNCSGESGIAGSGDSQAVAFQCKVMIYSFTDATLVVPAINNAREGNREDYWHREVPEAVGITFLPPVVLFLFGLLGLWIAKGFKG